MKNCAGRNGEMLSALPAPVCVWLAFGTGYLLGLSTLVAGRRLIPAYFLEPLDASIIIWEFPQKLNNADHFLLLFQSVSISHIPVCRLLYVIKSRKVS